MKPTKNNRRPVPQSDDEDDDQYNNYDDVEEDDDDEYMDDKNNYEDDEDEEDDDNDEEEEIKKQLSNVSFSTILKFKKNGPTNKLNLSKTATPSSSTSKANSVSGNKITVKKSITGTDREGVKVEDPKNKYNIKREKSDAPVEMTAMKPVSRFKQVVNNKSKLNVRDPRFDSLSGGKFDEELHRKRYGFLDGVVKNQLERMENQYKQMDECREKEILFKQIQSKKSQLKSQQIKDQKRDTRNKLVAKEIEHVKKGKTPYHISNKALKEFEIQEKFKQLKETNKLDQFMEKRRKKVSSKEKTFLPSRRSFDE